MADLPQGFDAADAAAEGWTPAQANAFLSTANPLAPIKSSGKAETRTQKRRQMRRDALTAILERLSLWHTTDGETYLKISYEHHTETHAVRSAATKRYLVLQFYKQTGGGLGAQALEDATRLLEAKACAEGIEQQPWLRVGRKGANVFLDMGDAAWRVVRIWSHGWEILERHDCTFIRSRRTRALCEPESGYSLDEFRPFVNVASEDDFILIVAWILAALWPRGPYPLLILTGEQGTGKTFLSRLLRSIIDPTSPETQSPPRDERDLIVAAQNTHCLFFDNLSHIDSVLSDALCRITSGSGFATRQLHSDCEEFIFSGARPVAVNSIPQIADRPDLADRAIIVNLVTIPDGERRTEAELEKAWEIARPRVLGALCDGISAALRNLP